MPTGKTSPALEKEYKTAERFLLSREFFGMKLGLDNIRTFLTDIGSPQNSYKTIHVSGTNGKGSTCAMLDSALREAGYKTGLFTSPHLISFRERIQVNRKLIPKQTVISFVKNYRHEMVSRELTFFEVMTALAFLHFKEANIDIGVIEVGLGGRLDATNVLTPELTICTDINYDHVDILGNTLAKIALEKAGIIKPGVPHLVGSLSAVAENVMRKRCTLLNAPLYTLSSRDYKTHPKTDSFDAKFNAMTFKNVQPGLIGEHQLRNSVLAAKALSLLPKRGIRISASTIKNGIAKAKWPGRFQLLKKKEMPLFICDVGHNPGGVEAFVHAFERRYPKRKVAIVAGFVKGKDHQVIFSSLLRIASQISLVRLGTHRTTDPKALIAEIDWKGTQVAPYRSLSQALRPLLKQAKSDDIIVILGSHYLVGEFLERFDTQ